MIGTLIIASLIIPIFLFLYQIRREYYWLQSMGGFDSFFDFEVEE